MRIETIENGFKATVPCKINLALHVLGRRTDGYHELDTVMLALNLCDEIFFWPNRTRLIRFDIQFPEKVEFGESDPAWDVPSNESNLIAKAMRLVFDSFGEIHLGGDVRVLKRIPSMAGLGGGSANCAGALVLGMLASGHQDQLIDCSSLASRLGSDVNFFLEGRNEKGIWCARCQGRGEKIQPIQAGIDSWFVIAHPPDGCKTVDVFRGITSWSGRLGAMEPLLACLQANQLSSLREFFTNDLEEPATIVTPWIQRARSWIDCYDHLGQSMTGSGSARFCLCASGEQAEKITEDLRRKGVRAFAVQPWRQPSLTDQLRTIRLTEA